MSVKTTALSVAFLLIVFVLTGCWDLKEPNELSFVLGSGWDLTSDKQFKLSVQIPVVRSSSPEQGGADSSKPPFTVVSSTGTNITNAAMHIQEQLSRKLFAGHRVALFISEAVARQGFMKWLDELIRNPDSNTRVYIFIVKGSTAEQFLKSEYAMERFSTTFANRTSRIVGFTEKLFDLEKEKNNPSKCFVLPVVSVHASGKNSQMAIEEAAIFDKDYKMVDFLKGEDALLTLWMRGKISHLLLTQRVSSENRTVSLDLQQLKHNLRFSKNGDRIRMNIKLDGTGFIRENNTNLYLLSPAVKENVAKEMSKNTEKEVIRVIRSIQKQYKTDLFGFGNEIAWKHPDQWKHLREHWSDTFSKMDVFVEVKLTIKGVGQVGSGPKG
ncbi:spore germination protein KC [Paenibacillus sp. UNC496MF]|uniref:Ger(x)C family spore germination protein n=1 Tax=Paenibacillus sp. UNC496MF TaxID=1502753 RepID=UPI0008E81F64|nr:Ger(x)C family spore germination protein [Paenibacillus sp. UNC496MF]SFJ59187.1 spore germination protein KC [Paenibacillus sp. UNC496MF]